MYLLNKIVGGLLNPLVIGLVMVVASGLCLWRNWRKAGFGLLIGATLGGNITPAEILAKTGPVDKVYIRVDENKAYWVRGEENGSVELW